MRLLISFWIACGIFLPHVAEAGENRLRLSGDIQITIPDDWIIGDTYTIRHSSANPLIMARKFNANNEVLASVIVNRLQSTKESVENINKSLTMPQKEKDNFINIAKTDLPNFGFSSIDSVDATMSRYDSYNIITITAFGNIGSIKYQWNLFIHPINESIVHLITLHRIENKDAINQLNIIMQKFYAGIRQ